MKKLKILLKKRWIIPIAVLLLFTAVSAGKGIVDRNNKNLTEEDIIKKQVKTTVISLSSDNSSFIEAVGTIQAETQVDIIATTRGTLKNLYFEIGDKIFLNKTLAILYNNSTLTNLNNAKTNLTNTENNLNVTDRLTQENIRQAEIGINSAEEFLIAAEIGLKTAQDNLKNSQDLRTKGNEDTENSAIISYNGFLNTCFSTLSSINSILKIDEFSINQNQNLLDPGLGAKNLNSLRDAQSKYRIAKKTYEEIKNIILETETIKSNFKMIVQALDELEQAVDSMITLLDNSVSGQNLNQATIDSQKSSFISSRTTVIASQSSAKTIEQALQNLGLYENKEITNYKNAVSSAEAQLNIAQTSLDNALQNLENTKQGRNQQILGSQSSLDNAQGQYNLARSSASDLYIKAPISGTITGKYIEVGAEINPGQKIAQISQTNMLKIEINLPSEDVYRINRGQEVIIGENKKGVINSINPAADPITKKVKIEILYDNKNNDLIQGTFIDVVMKAKALEKTHEEAVFIPLKIVTTTQTESFVYLVKDNIAKKQIISLGKAEGALIEILDGLNEGDVLVVDGGKSLEEGDVVEVTE